MIGNNIIFTQSPASETVVSWESFYKNISLLDVTLYDAVNIWDVVGGLNSRPRI